MSEVITEDTTSPEILEFVYSAKSESIILVGCQTGHVQHSAICRALVEPDRGPNLESQLGVLLLKSPHWVLEKGMTHSF